MGVLYLNQVTAPIRKVIGAQVGAVIVVFTQLPPSQKILPTYAFLNDVDGEPVEPISDRVPNIGRIVLVDDSTCILQGEYPLNYVRNICRFSYPDAHGIELWIRPSSICDIAIYY